MASPLEMAAEEDTDGDDVTAPDSPLAVSQNAAPVMLASNQIAQSEPPRQGNVVDQFSQIARQYMPDMKSFEEARARRRAAADAMLANMRVTEQDEAMPWQMASMGLSNAPRTGRFADEIGAMSNGYFAGRGALDKRRRDMQGERYKIEMGLAEADEKALMGQANIARGAMSTAAALQRADRLLTQPKTPLEKRMADLNLKQGDPDYDRIHAREEFLMRKGVTPVIANYLNTRPDLDVRKPEVLLELQKLAAIDSDAVVSRADAAKARAERAEAEAEDAATPGVTQDRVKAARLGVPLSPTNPYEGLGRKERADEWKRRQKEYLDTETKDSEFLGKVAGKEGTLKRMLKQLEDKAVSTNPRYGIPGVGSVLLQGAMQFDKNLQQFNADSAELVGGAYVPGEGAISNFERQLIANRMPNPGFASEVNANILRVMISLPKQLSARAEARQRYIDANKTIDGFDAQWRAYVEDNPYFSPPSGKAKGLEPLKENASRQTFYEWAKAKDRVPK